MLDCARLLERTVDPATSDIESSGEQASANWKKAFGYAPRKTPARANDWTSTTSCTNCIKATTRDQSVATEIETNEQAVGSDGEHDE